MDTNSERGVPGIRQIDEPRKQIDCVRVFLCVLFNGLTDLKTTFGIRAFGRKRSRS